MYEQDVCVYQTVCVCFYSGLVFVVWALCLECVDRMYVDLCMFFLM